MKGGIILRVKIFRQIIEGAINICYIEENINEFILDKKIIEIKQSLVQISEGKQLIVMTVIYEYMNKKDLL